MASSVFKAIILSTLLWIIAFALQGAGLVANSCEPWIGDVPFSLFYAFCMGIWGVLNSIAMLKLWLPKIYERARKVLVELSEGE